MAKKRRWAGICRLADTYTGGCRFIRELDECHGWELYAHYHGIKKPVPQTGKGVITQLKLFR